MSNLGDYYFIKELLDRETALSHNNETGYYSVNANFFSSNFVFPESSYAYSFYNAMRAVFRSNYDYSNDMGFSNHETLHFFTFSGDDNLYYCFHNTPNIRGNLSRNEYYEVQFNPQQSTRNIYKYDTSTNEISVYSHMGSGSSYKSVPVYKFLASTGSLFVWGTSTNTNYVNIEGNSGNTSGGWQVPNPNPTRKIVINGVNYSQDEDGNMNKIVLNGVEYANSKGGQGVDFVLNDETIATSSTSPYTVTLDGKLPNNLYFMSVEIVEENNVINNLINYVGGSLTVTINGNTCVYTVSFSGNDVANTIIETTCTWGSWKTLKCKLSVIDASQQY